MKSRWLMMVVAVAFTAALVYVNSAPAPAKENRESAEALLKAMRPAKLGEPAPDFVLKDVYGKPFKLSEFKDRPVVLEWINKKCPISADCHKRKVMQDTYKKYAAKGVVWLAIDTTVGRKPEENRVYAAELGLAYPILHDVDGRVGRAYQAATTPHMFVIDDTGKLVYDGAIDDHDKTNYVVAALDAVLKGEPVATAKTKPYGCTVKYPPPPKPEKIVP